MFKPEAWIIVAEDMDNMRENMVSALKELGYQSITETSDGKEAWFAAVGLVDIGKKPELIISDWEMPSMTGLELLKNVRQHPELHATPFLMVTSVSEAAQVLAAIKAGVSNYIVKPVNAATLKEKLALVWKKHNP